MKVAIIYNEDMSGVINRFGLQNRELYNPATVKRVAEALERGGHNVRVFDGNMYVVDQLQEFMPPPAAGEQSGLVFNMAYGIQGESRYTHLPAMLEMLGIPYVGSGPAGHALALDKVMTKVVLQHHGLPTPEYQVFSSPEEEADGVSYPAIVKPKLEAVSYGVRVVRDEAELREAIAYVLAEFQQQVLVERFVRGREFAVGLLGNGLPEALPLVEFDLGGDPEALQTDADKLRAPRPKICPAEVSAELAEELVRISREAFRALGMRDFARVDFRLDEENQPYVLEVNSMASLGPSGSYVHAAEVAGYDYAALVNKMLEVAAVRYFALEGLPPEKKAEAARKRFPLAVRLRGFLRSKRDETEKLLVKFVNVDTHVRNVDGVNQLGRLLGRQLGPLGFSARAVAGAEVGDSLLFANFPEEAEYDALLLGHLDHGIPFANQTKYRESRLRLYGTAIWDNKAGLAVLVAALRGLRFVRLLRRIRLGVLLTADNTLQNRTTKNILQEVSARARYVLGLNGGAPPGTVVTSRSGAASYRCEMSLADAAAAADVAEANSRFAQLLNQLVKLSSEEGELLVAVREARLASDVGSRFASGEAALSVRFNRPEQAEAVEAKINALVKKARSDKYRFQISGAVRRPPMVKTAATEELYLLARERAGRLDLPLSEEHRWSSSDICFADADRPRLDGLGPVGEAHPHAEEDILRHSVLDRAALLALALNELRGSA
ncbi:MAG: ATP-grasp domain-containing protein [Candidatus Coatesbacteria bacterium]|nr:MAG: ATP-grasp domain-containing protein [Candidatus Coatesbacteria bacterium]